MPDDQPQISVLYVEDEQSAREILCSVFESKYRFTRLDAAENGEQGVALFKEHRHDIVITDISMPVMDGVEMAAAIRDIAPETVIIVLTAHSGTRYLLDSIELGISNYVLKPVNYEKLFAAIDKSIAMISLKRQVASQHRFIRRLSRAVEQSPSTVLITDGRGQIEYANPKFFELTGYSPQEVMGKNPRILKSGVMSPAFYGGLWCTISSGNEWRGEFLNRKKNGEFYWESAAISPVMDDTGAITNYVAVKEDITARKRAEEKIEALNAALADRARELESANVDLEAFNYTVSHDLRSPLTIIGSYSQLLLDKCGANLDEQGEKIVGIISRTARQMEALLSALMAFSRLSHQAITRETVDLTAIASGVRAELRMQEPDRHTGFCIQEGVTCCADRQLMHIVLSNLMGNAWKYTALTDEPRIEFGMSAADGKPVYFVRDNGVGFDMAKADRMFGTFQRLHDDDAFEGFGIGLATVQRIIDRHQGRIWAQGEPGKGATFFFSL
ncbi:response regulator [Geobacter sp. FeAm09]|uniref:sensor histidine kinase n=1 Tax=Geobacter sp. FeAm09 TaxID=2597769 RepID=UPI0011EDA3E8|nr:response regulator [Geobacter sp. FeAm09]QEM68583.1 response regulator [Geobacter sp. FeAm09]